MDTTPTIARQSAAERVTIVRTLDDIQRVAAVRAIVYMHGQDCPYAEEFDGNDFCGLHLLGWIGVEPVASLRLRFFGGFAKLERLAVRPEHRRSAIAFKLVREALRIARRKGFPRAYGHARIGLEDFWSRFGARPMGEPGSFGFSGERYTEMVLDLAPIKNALQLGDDPLVLNRPEGEWDQAGVLEPAARRSGEEEADGRWSSDVRTAWSPWVDGRVAGFEEAAQDFMGAQVESSIPQPAPQEPHSGDVQQWRAKRQPIGGSTALCRRLTNSVQRLRARPVQNWAPRGTEATRVRGVRHVSQPARSTPLGRVITMGTSALRFRAKSDYARNSGS